MQPRSLDLNEKPYAKKWLESNKEAAAVFMTVKDWLRAMYRGDYQGFINKNQNLAEYRFNKWPEGGLIVTGHPTSTVVMVNNVATRVPRIFKVYAASQEKDITSVLSFLSQHPVVNFQFPTAPNLFSRDDSDFHAAVEQAMKLNAAQRKAKIDAAPTVPDVVRREIKTYVRNPYVVAERLLMAKGVCEKCRKKAPFNRRSTNPPTPYLEVHHIEQLAKGGLDTVKNTEALCPNCHRERHHG